MAAFVMGKFYTKMIVILLIAMTLNYGNGAILTPGLPQECYTKRGDLDIGFIMNIHNSGEGGNLCSDKLQNYGNKYVMAVKYTIDKINSDDHLLPNLTLGFTIHDGCSETLSQMASALKFLPDDKVPNVSKGEPHDNCEGEIFHSKVVGVVGLSTSKAAFLIGSLLSIFRIPTLSLYASSDELSDKTQFEYFTRMVPPDRYQAEAIIDIIEHFNWSYISLIYSEGKYGENGAIQIEKRLRERPICIAYSQMIFSSDTSRHVDNIVQELWKQRNAKVVIVFLEGDHLRSLLDSVRNQKVKGDEDKIWLGSDSMGFTGLDGAIIIHHTLKEVPDFNRYFRSLSYRNHDVQHIPWMAEDWSRIFKCNWTHSNQPESCSNYENRTIGSTHPWIGPYVSRNIDSVYVIGHALDTLIKQKCPDATIYKEKLKKCVTGEDLLVSIRNVNIEGHSGRIRFDSKGDSLASYVIVQYSERGNKYVEIGTWDRESHLTLHNQTMYWAKSFAQERVPKSACSSACSSGEYYIPSDIPCCWDCGRCFENDIPNANQTGCVKCPLYTWPDSVNYSVCLPIMPTYLSFSSPAGITIITFSCIGLSSTMVLASVVWIKRRTKLIKASSRELTVFIFLGIVMTFFSAVTFLLEPDHGNCLLSRLGFNFSPTMIFAPLFIKSNRTYRIFESSKRNKRPQCTSGLWQLKFVVIIIGIQGVISSISIMYERPEAKMMMPNAKPYVEIHCGISLFSLLLPVSFNLIVLFLAAIFGFLTRSFPENFNDSWYSFVSVTTTCFLWVVFLPSYITAFYAVYKVAILASCLVINASVSLLVLFLPKVYALYMVDENLLQFMNQSLSTQVQPVSVVTLPVPGPSQK